MKEMLQRNITLDWKKMLKQLPFSSVYIFDKYRKLTLQRLNIENGNEPLVEILINNWILADP